MPEDQAQISNKETSPVVLQSVDKVIAYWKLWPNTTAKAILYGVITRVNDMGKIVFFVLADGSGSIQLRAKVDDFSPEEWVELKAHKSGARVRIVGTVGETPLPRKRLSIFLQEIPCELRELKDKGLSLAWPNIKVVSNQMLLSRIRRHCSRFLENEGFLEIEPFYISRSWQGEGLHPLEVKYPGFGMPVFLVPSPGPQILKAIVTTGSPKIFSVSRCFTGEFRDTMDRAETVLICAKMYPASLEEIRNLAVKAVKSVFSDLSPPSKDQELLEKEWPDIMGKWPPQSGHVTPSKEVQVEVFEEINGGNKLFGEGRLKIFRVSWPYAASSVYICDGIIETYEDGFTVGTMNLHADRMVHILEETVSRQLLSLDYWTAPPTE
jgi:lysyl-tRNA synthetase class II